MTGFHQHDLGSQGDPFRALSHGVILEDVARGRRGNHLVDVGERGVPIVRTTTQYTRPAHRFSSAHHEVIAQIQRVALEGPHDFNNALIEVYDRGYHKMGYHSDQALDLEEGSFIALYSCYEHPGEGASLRTLKIRDKITQEESEIVLRHDSVVLFSMATNTAHSHKIVLEPVPPPNSPKPDNRWLGITFRTSKTRVRFDEGTPRLSDGATLRLATEPERKAFYRLRGQENRSMDFVYPQLDFTISPADLLPPRG